MFRNSAVLVLGAGASCEYDFPTGDILRKKIVDLLRFELEFGSFKSGDHTLFKAITLFDQNFPREVEVVNELLKIALEIRSSLHQAPSIDQYIFNRSSVPGVAQLGKLAISRGIQYFEKRSRICRSVEESRNKKFSDLKIEGTWLPKFFQLLIDGCGSIDEVAERCSRLTVVSFNYDRVFKEYLLGALTNYFPGNESEAIKAAMMVDVIHPYGSLGPLPWEVSSGGYQFGAELSATKLKEIAENIKTFTESADSGAADVAKAAISSAAMVVFLGFGFHSQNLDFLQTTVDERCRLFATASGFSDFDRFQIANELIQRFRVDKNSVHLFGGYCSDLFDEYSRAFKLIGF